MSESARQWVRTLLGAFRFVIPPEAQELAEWESLEPDTTGTLRARYAWRGEHDAERRTRELDKQRLEYLPESLPPGRAEVGGGGQARWNPQLGWIEAAQVSERLQMESADLGIAVTYTLAGRMHLVTCEDRLAVAQPGLWEGAWDPPGTSAAETAPSAEQNARWLADQLGDATLNQLLDELAIALETFGPDSQEAYMAMTRLGWLLELRPEQALELEKILLAGLLDEQTASLAVVALGQAGTIQSQLVLAACVGDPLRPQALRMAALQSAFQVPAPCPELLAGIRSTLTDGAPRPLAGTAMLLLGKLADSDGAPAPESASAPESEQQASLLDELLAHEETAQELGLLDVWLEALGNCGDPAIVPHVTPYLTHSEPQIRAAALAALGSVDSVDAVQSLASVAQQDPDPSLRVLSVEMLGTQVSALATETVCAVAIQDASEAVRMAAVQALAALQGTDELVELTLQTCAQGDPSASVRDLAASILAGA
jgi:HEAT repeat protein